MTLYKLSGNTLVSLIRDSLNNGFNGIVIVAHSLPDMKENALSQFRPANENGNLRLYQTQDGNTEKDVYHTIFGNDICYSKTIPKGYFAIVRFPKPLKEIAQ